MVVLLPPEEYKLRVGGMSATELRQQLGKYWGQGGILGSDVEEGYQVMRVPVGTNSCLDNRPLPPKQRHRERLVQLNCIVFSHWVDRECTQWLNYFMEIGRAHV